MKTIYIGVDVCKKFLDIASPNNLQKISNSSQACRKLIQSLPPNAHVLVEASGGCERTLLLALREADVPASRLNPRNVRDFARAKGLLAKTDAIDAQVLRSFGDAFHPTPDPLPAPWSEALAELVTERDHVKSRLLAERNRLSCATLPETRRMARARIRSLNNQMKRLLTLMREIKAQHVDLGHHVDRFCMIKGVGELSALCLLATMPELGTLNRGQAAALAGVAPFNRDSGPWRGKRSIYAGRPAVRRILYKEALLAADTAIAIDPDQAFNYAAKADAFSSLERWADAEQEARAALTLDPRNDYASNLLASLLRLQGKQWESEFAVEQLLANSPEDAYAHFNAGWSAMQAHNAEKAEEHFREALRLDPDFDAAREGLLESFKARSAFYRIYLRYCFWMQRFTAGTRWLIIIGLYLAFRFGNRALQSVSPLASGIFIAAYLSFVLWVWLAPGIGSFLVMSDKSARYALKKGEKIEAISVGGGLIVAVLSFGLGVGFEHLPSIILGVILAIATVPASMTFTNEQPKGRLLFGSVYFGSLGIGLIAFLTESIRGTTSLDDIRHSSETLLMFALVACAACTWLGNVPSLRETAD